MPRVNVAIVFVIACTLLAVSQAASGQSSPAHPSAKRAQVSKEFKSLGGDALDAIDRAFGTMLKSEQVFETAVLEATRLVQKLVRVASSDTERKAAAAIRGYANQVETCRLESYVAGADGERFDPCLKELGERRDAARVSLGLPAKDPY